MIQVSKSTRCGTGSDRKWRCLRIEAEKYPRQGWIKVGLSGDVVKLRQLQHTTVQDCACDQRFEIALSRRLIKRGVLLG